MDMLVSEHFPLRPYETFTVKDGEGRVVETWSYTGSTKQHCPKGKVRASFHVRGYRGYRGAQAI